MKTTSESGESSTNLPEPIAQVNRTADTAVAGKTARDVDNTKNLLLSKHISELLERAHSLGVSAPAALPSLEPQITFSASDQYHVNDLLSFHDRQFVEHAHLALLKRPPALSESDCFVNELRSGRMNKVSILEALHDSPEGRASRVRLYGLPSRPAKFFSRVPVLGYALRVLKGVWRLPMLLDDQQRFEAYALARQQLLTEDVKRLSDRSEDPLRTLVEDIAETTAILAEELHKASAELAAACERISDMENDMENEQKNVSGRGEFLVQEQAVLIETQHMIHLEMKDRVEELRDADARFTAELKAMRERLGALINAE